MSGRRDFGKLLRAELEAAGEREGLGRPLPILTLSRRIAENTFVDVESVRSLVYKYLRGEHLPDQPMRESLARALGLAPDFFGSDADWEREMRIVEHVEGVFKRAGIAIEA